MSLEKPGPSLKRALESAACELAPLARGEWDGGRVKSIEDIFADHVIGRLKVLSATDMDR